MSKKEQFEAFLAAVLPAVPEDKRAAVEEALRAESVSNIGGDFVLRQNDYSKRQDELRREADRLAADRQKWEEWYTQAAPEAQRLAAEAESATATLKAYEARYGKLENPGGPPAQTLDPAAMLKLMQEELDKRDRYGFAVMNTLSDIKLEHASKFKGERLNVDDVLKIAQERGLPLAEAYKSFVAPREEEMKAKEVEDRIKRAREEGATEALSKHNLPTAPSSPSPSIFNLPTEGVIRNEFDRQRTAAANFVAALNQQN
jgi:hypothetical protein